MFSILLILTFTLETSLTGLKVLLLVESNSFGWTSSPVVGNVWILYQSFRFLQSSLVRTYFPTRPRTYPTSRGSQGSGNTTGFHVFLQSTRSSVRPCGENKVKRTEDQRRVSLIEDKHTPRCLGPYVGLRLIHESLSILYLSTVLLRSPSFPEVLLQEIPRL